MLPERQLSQYNFLNVAYLNGNSVNIYFCRKYLHILRRLLRRIRAGFCSGFAPVSEHRHLRCRIAVIVVASPSHRRIASPPHRVAGELPTSLKLHLPAVHPTRCTRTEEVQPQQWALSDAANTCRSQRL
jgi:hypothetical protein